MSRPMCQNPTKEVHGIFRKEFLSQTCGIQSCCDATRDTPGSTTHSLSAGFTTLSKVSTLEFYSNTNITHINPCILEPDRNECLRWIKRTLPFQCSHRRFWEIKLNTCYSFYDILLVILYFKEAHIPCMMGNMITIGNVRTLLFSSNFRGPIWPPRMTHHGYSFLWVLDCWGFV